MDTSKEVFNDIYENPDNQKILAKTVYVASTRARKGLTLFYKTNPLDFLLSEDLLQKKEAK